MIIIGEKLNSSIPAAFAAYRDGDEEYIRTMAGRQAENGAQYLDLNASMLPDEVEKLVWAAKLAMEACGAGLSLDSPDPHVLAAAAEKLGGRPLLFNSVTLEKERLEGVLPLLKRTDAGVVALPISDDGMPQTAEDRVENGKRLITVLTDAGVAPDSIYLDLIAEAVSADWEAPRRALEACAALRAAFPEVHLLAGVSNVSFGLPKRLSINRAFLSSAVAMGLDAAILDITDPQTRMEMLAACMVNGQDEYCAEYIAAYRELAEQGAFQA